MTVLFPTFLRPITAMNFFFNLMGVNPHSSQAECQIGTLKGTREVAGVLTRGYHMRTCAADRIKEMTALRKRVSIVP